MVGRVLQETTEQLRLRARNYRQAAEKGPRRDRAYHLTYAFCLEQRAQMIERGADASPAAILEQP